MFSFAATAGTANVNPLDRGVANAACVDDPAEVLTGTIRARCKG
jgi:hypothetical protein